MAAVTELATAVGTRAACRALCVCRVLPTTGIDVQTLSGAATALRPRPARALCPEEREAVLAHLHGERFQDRSPSRCLCDVAR
jgi:hypothetical protein